MKRSVGLFVIAGLTVSFTACTKLASSTHVTTNGGAQPGVVRYGLSSDLNTLNPITTTLAAEQNVIGAIFDGLVELDDQQRLLPDLAIEVPSQRNGGISRDGRTIVYHLRHGVRWHDGQPFTASDVLFTFETIINPHVNAANTAIYQQVQHIAAPDPYTVVVRLRSPSAPAVGQLFCNGENGSIIPRHLLQHSIDFNRDPFNVHPIGTGPMELESWERGARMVLRPNPYYFRGAPHVQRLEILLVPDNNTRLTMLEAKELDITQIPVASQLPRLRALPNYSVALARSYTIVEVSFNLTRAPFNDLRVRQALTLALDRKKLVAYTYGESGIVADSTIAPYSWAYTRDNGALPYDPQRAAALLDQAGWRVGADGVRSKAGKRLEFSLLTYAGATQRTVLAQQMQSEWRAIGALASLRPLPTNVMFSRTSMYETAKYDVSLDGFIFDPDPDRLTNFGSAFFTPVGFNGSRISDPVIDDLLQRGISLYSHAERKPYYDRLQRRVNQLVPIIPLAWPQTIYVFSNAVHGFRPEPVNTDFWNIQDWRM